MHSTSTVRVFFRTGEVDRQVCWLQMSGDDFYVGASKRERANLPSVPILGTSVELSVPDEVAYISDSGLKASYHASGQFHVKAGGALASTPDSWPRKGSIASPLRVAALITRPPVKHDKYERSLTRGSADTIVLKVNEQNEQLRHYFEFFLSPAGRFAVPATLLKTSVPLLDAPICHSLNDRLVLAIRSAVLARAMPIHTWQPEIEVWFYAREIASEAVADA